MTTESDARSAQRTGCRSGRGPRVLPVVLTLLLAACGGADAGVEADGQQPEPVTLYTCLSDESIQPVIEAFRKSAAGGRVDLFRAPTGELNARVAADVRSGGLRADVVWGCDPLTVQ